MKRILLTGLALVLLAAVANAQVGTLDIFDETDVTCALVDAPGLVTLHLWHTNIVSGAEGNQFIIDKGTGVTLTHLATTTPEITILIIGDADTGVSTSYGSCRASDFHFMTVLYSGAGTSTACSYLSILPSPNSLSGLVEIINCAHQKVTSPSGGQAILNDDGSCTCNVPVEETTWGKVKALYE